MLGVLLGAKRLRAPERCRGLCLEDSDSPAATLRVSLWAFNRSQEESPGFLCREAGEECALQSLVRIPFR